MAMGWFGNLVIGAVIAFLLFGAVVVLLAGWLAMETDDLRRKIEGEEEEEE